MARVVIKNDSVNSFKGIIIILGEIFKYKFTRCEQLTLMIHHNGEATVKTTKDTVEAIDYETVLSYLGLNVKVEV